MGKVGRLAPEKITVDLRDQIVALKALLVIELIIRERERPLPLIFQKIDLLL